MSTKPGTSREGLTATKSARVVPFATAPQDVSKLIQQYGCGPVQFSGTDNALYERHLIFDNIVDPAASDARMKFEAFAHSVRDILSQRWVRTESTYERENPKRAYYLSMEFLIGRSLSNNITNLLLDPLVKVARKAILNVASSGKFSTDRTIFECADEIWKVKPCPVP
jgi:glucan phosphorylase